MELDSVTVPGDAEQTIADSTAETGVAPVVLTPHGWGPLRIGMSRAEVVAAAGEDANPEAIGGPEPDRCDEFRPVGVPEGMRLMLEEGRLTRISVARDTSIRTAEGFVVGDAADEIRAAYGPRVEMTPHKYVDAPAAYLTVWSVPPPPDSTARGIVYEIGLDARVEQIHAGTASIRYVEGCL